MNPGDSETQKRSKQGRIQRCLPYTGVPSFLSFFNLGTRVALCPTAPPTSPSHGYISPLQKHTRIFQPLQHSWSTSLHSAFDTWESTIARKRAEDLWSWLEMTGRRTDAWCSTLAGW